jgi:hypothetical protein
LYVLEFSPKLPPVASANEWTPEHLRYFCVSFEENSKMADILKHFGCTLARSDSRPVVEALKMLDKITKENVAYPQCVSKSAPCATVTTHYAIHTRMRTPCTLS